MVFVLKNYNKFLIQASDGCGIRWDDFYIHRFNTDFRRLVKFNTRFEALRFLVDNPQFEDRFDAWVVETTEDDWS